MKHWQYLCIYGSLTGEFADKTNIMCDGKEIFVTQEETELVFIDANTGEILLIQSEYGWPMYKSDWADSESNIKYEYSDEEVM